ncbi:uncharacterized protein LOC110458928 isoform X1 [Mizuhopecten yessoensis]|uniref:uncharacterized protein LOC110458928 isoform X1 n=1 Tax=Mizuhopecten yessoensis TaxID=6573 RepID=UPI000B45D7ED|nr:uncharacterized protein LOC110458928 isoform X1 [Mizuhopecten yessoensis]
MNSSLNVTYSLEEEDYDEFKKSGNPGMVYLIVLCIVGTVGNTHVFLVYFLRFKTSVHQIFVLCLACVDFVGCIFCIPATLYIIRHPNTVQSLPYCKVYRAITYSVGTYSLLILAWIAVERYRQVCHATRVQFTTRITRIVCTVSCVLMLVLVVIPVTIIYGINRKTTQAHSLLGFECDVLDHFKGSTLAKTYMGTFLIVYLSLVIISAVMYILIRKKLYAHQNNLRNNGTVKSAITTFCVQESGKTGSKSVFPKDGRKQDNRYQENDMSGDIEISATAASCVCDVDVLRESCVMPTVPQDTVMKGNDTKIRHSNQQQQSRVTGINHINTLTRNDHKRQRQLDRSRTITLVFLVVSIISFGVYLPYLVLTLFWHFNSSLYNNFVNNYGSLENIICNLFFLNNVINPFIYGFMDKKLRTELSKIYVNMKHYCDVLFIHSQ